MVSNYRNIYGNIVISTRLCDGGSDDNDDDDDNNGRGGDDDVFFWVYNSYPSSYGPSSHSWLTSTPHDRQWGWSAIAVSRVI